MIKIGIECENLEDPKSCWGIGQITLNLLLEYAKNPEWQKKYKLYLYFKKNIPDDEVLKNLIFIKRVLGFPSFNIFYHILMPVRAMLDRVDWMFFPAYQLPPLYIGKSIVVLTEDAYYEYKYGNLPFRYKLSYRIFTNWAAKFATKIMAISETSKKELTRVYNIKPEKIIVNYLGVGLNMQTGSRIQQPSNYILFVGQMFPRRHAKETILAFQKIIEEYYNTQTYTDKLENLRMLDLKLILIGPDKYEKPVIKLLVSEVNNRLGREAVIHKEYVSNEELTELYSGAKALVYVSDREAFGLPPMEALSFGVPPIIADNELGHELFGEYAFYVSGAKTSDNNILTFCRMLECHTPDKIADVMKRALTDSQKIGKIKSEGPEFVKKYNWKSFADRLIEIIT